MDITDTDVTFIEEKSILLFVLFYILGTVSLIPQYFYITANDYWMFKFRDVGANSADDDDKTELQKKFTAYYSTVSTICTSVFVLVTMALAKKIPLQPRIIGSIGIIMVMFFVTLIFIWIDTDSWQGSFFVIALVIGGILAGVSGTFIISAFELASKFPAAYLGAEMSGQSLCGILAAVLQILTLSFDISSQNNAMIYFSICTFIMVATLIYYLLVFYYNESFRTYLRKEEESEANEKLDFSNFKTVFKNIALLLIALVITSGSAGIVFPGVTSLVESEGKGTSRWSDVFFVPVCNYLAFHSFDFIGREVALRWLKFENIYVILVGSILRMAFLPLLIFCNAQPRSHLPVAFVEDYVFIIFMILFAFTNGYFLNLCVILIPSMAKPNEKSLATFIILLAILISSGLLSFLGSVMVNAL